MLFWFPEDVAGQGFTMKGAVVPLDIAFFSANGELVSIDTMPLCDADPCPTYGADASFRFAVEAEAGALSGLAPGATLELPGASPWRRALPIVANGPVDRWRTHPMMRQVETGGQEWAAE